MRFAALGLAVAVLGGCGTTIDVTNDTYCKLGRKITWSKSDTQPTVHQIRVHNAKLRRICG